MLPLWVCTRRPALNAHHSPRFLLVGSPYQRPGDCRSDTICSCWEVVCVCVFVCEREIQLRAADMKRVMESDMAVASTVMPWKLLHSTA